MSTTNFMGLALPTVSVTLGPQYATENNTAFESIDSHDHTSGKGVKVPTAGLNIDADLTFNSHKATNLLTAKFISNSATQTGSTNANSVYVTTGDLYFTNSAGTAVQITSGGAITASPAQVQSYELQSVTGNITIAAAATPVYFLVNTTATRSITLPLAVNVVSGRIYKFKDISGQADTNNITLTAAGSDTIDGAATYTLDANLGSWELVGDGVSAWHVS